MTALPYACHAWQRLQAHLKKSRISNQPLLVWTANEARETKRSSDSSSDEESEVHMSKLCPLYDELLPIAADGLRLKQVKFAPQAISYYDAQT